MKIIAQTILNPVMVVYDSASPAGPEGQGIGKDTLLKIIKPVVAVTDDNGKVIYKTGEFYTPYLFYGLLLLAGVLIVRKIL